MLEYKFTKKATKEMRMLPKNIQRKVFSDIEIVCYFDHPLQSRDVLKLKGAYEVSTFRFRSGNYRIIFRFANNIILIGSVRHRQRGY